MTGHTYDIVILGGGSGGYACALRASQLGLSVALIERDKLGGTCLHRGCVPTKSLLHVGEVVDTVKAGAGFGVDAAVNSIAFDEVHAFKNGVVDRLHRGLSSLVDAAPNVTVVHGTGTVVDAHTVRVDDAEHTGANLVLATGSRPRTLPGVDITGRIVTSDGALALAEVPKRAVVIGGSVIGVEFASLWRSLGSEVTIVESLGTLVPQEDPSVSKKLERAFRKRKIGFTTNAKVVEVSQTESVASVTLDSGRVLEADVVLVAVGREPVSSGLGLEEAGISLDRGWVSTDDRLRSNIPSVYAVGDLVPGPQLAHRGFAHGIFVAEHIAGLGPAPVVDTNLPRVTYSDPEIASVGLTESRAREAFGAVDTVEYNLAGNGRSLVLGTAGSVKIVRKQNGPIVGVHMVGARMSEQIGEATLAVTLNVHPEELASIVHAHPTQNESIGEAALALAGKPLHAHT
ncbi:dihydrolipoyl dehydrogenase [Rhodococcus triatomae]